jgi:hypothetical protein
MTAVPWRSMAFRSVASIAFRRFALLHSYKINLSITGAL